MGARRALRALRLARHPAARRADHRVGHDPAGQRRHRTVAPLARTVPSAAIRSPGSVRSPASPTRPSAPATSRRQCDTERDVLVARWLPVGAPIIDESLEALAGIDAADRPARPDRPDDGRRHPRHARRLGGPPSPRRRSLASERDRPRRRRRPPHVPCSGRCRRVIHGFRQGHTTSPSARSPRRSTDAAAEQPASPSSSRGCGSSCRTTCSGGLGGVPRARRRARPRAMVLGRRCLGCHADGGRAGRLDGITSPRSASELTTAAAAVAARIDVLEPLARAHEPSSIELDLDAADRFLEQAPAELERLGIELIGPERLVRANLVGAGHGGGRQPDRAASRLQPRGRRRLAARRRRR